MFDYWTWKSLARWFVYRREWLRGILTGQRLMNWAEFRSFVADCVAVRAYQMACNLCDKMQKAKIIWREDTADDLWGHTLVTMTRKAGDCDDHAAVLADALSEAGFKVWLVYYGYTADGAGAAAHAVCLYQDGSEWGAVSNWGASVPGPSAKEALLNHFPSPPYHLTEIRVLTPGLRRRPDLEAVVLQK